MEIDLRDDDYFIALQQLVIYNDKLIQGDRSAKNFIRRYESEIREIKQNTVKPDLTKNRMIVEKWFGQSLKEKTVREFISIFQLMKEEADKNNRNGSKDNEGQDL